MIGFVARWGALGPDVRDRRVTCGRPGLDGGCPGKLGWAMWLDGVGWRLSHTEGYYYRDGPNRYRLGFRDRDANGRPHRYAGSKGRRANPLLDDADQHIMGQSPVAPATIVCPVCHRDNEVQEPPAPR